MKSVKITSMLLLGALRTAELDFVAVGVHIWAEERAALIKLVID